jgi:hypothetical protein
MQHHYITAKPKVVTLSMNGKLQYTHYANLNMVERCEFPLLSQAVKTSMWELFLFAVKIIRAIWLNIVYHLQFFQTHDPV